jgi:hypothetical protein
MNNELTTIYENPYQSPLTIGQDASSGSYPSATKAFLAGAKRGAKLGGKWMGLILGTLSLAVIAFSVVVIVYRASMLGYESKIVLEFLGVIGSLLFGTAGVTLLTAVICSIIMGIGESVYHWQSRRKAKSTTTS